jgi:hypothetical protein
MTDRKKLLATLDELGVVYTEWTSKVPNKAKPSAGAQTKVVSVGQGHLHFFKSSEKFVGVEWDDTGHWDPRCG